MVRRGHRLGFRRSVARQGQLLGWQPAVVILVVTAAVHLTVLGALGWAGDHRVISFDVPRLEQHATNATATAANNNTTPPPPSGAAPTVVTLIDLPPKGAPLPAILGPTNDSSFDHSHPAPDMDVILPGDRAASRGGGARGGAETWTGRHDNEDLRSAMWNHPDRYQTPRQKTSHRVRSTEALARHKRRGYQPTTDRRRRARKGDAHASAGSAKGRGRVAMAVAVTRQHNADDIRHLAAETARQHKARASGRTVARRSRALTDVGVPTTETLRKGKTADKRTTVGLIHERDPQPFDLSRPSAHGAPGGHGVAGPHRAPGVASRGHGVGTAATRADLLPGWGRPSSRAPLEHPYFRRIYKRLDRLVVFPHELALRLEQGEVIVSFRLHASGRISDVHVTKRSGFRKFDRAVVTALRRAAPFGRVPSSILKGSQTMLVKAPYAFSNPLIQ